MIGDAELARRRLESWVKLGATARQLRGYVFAVASVVLLFLGSQPFAGMVLAVDMEPALAVVLLMAGLLLFLAALCIYRMGVWHGRNGVLVAAEEAGALDLSGEDEESLDG